MQAERYSLFFVGEDWTPGEIDTLQLGIKRVTAPAV